MEEDEEIIKKLMNMLGTGRELKFKSPNGQTIRVSFEGSAFNDTQPESEKEPSQDRIEGERGAEDGERREEEDEDEGDPFLSSIQEDFKEMAQDFHALNRAKDDE